MKYLYTDLPEHKQNDGFKDLSSLEINDEIEVCLYELGEDLDKLFQSIDWRLNRLKGKIEIKFIDDHTFSGHHLVKILPLK